MERALRTKAEGVRQAIAATAQQKSLQWSFRVNRGNVAQMVLTESLEADLLLVGRESPSLELSPPRLQPGPVMFVDEGSASGDHVSDTAQRLARPHADAVERCWHPAMRRGAVNRTTERTFGAASVFCTHAI